MYEEMLNGGNWGAPAVAAVTAQAGAPAAGQDSSRSLIGRGSSTQTIVIAWLILFALLVLAHVVTLSLQR